MNLLLLLQSGKSGGMPNMIFIILIIVVFVFFIIVPNYKKQKELKKLRNNLKKGEKILTTGGIYGKVIDVKEYYVLMEVEDKSVLRVDKSAVIKDMSDIQQAGKK